MLKTLPELIGNEEYSDNAGVACQMQCAGHYSTRFVFIIKTDDEPC